MPLRQKTLVLILAVIGLRIITSFLGCTHEEKTIYNPFEGLWKLKVIEEQDSITGNWGLYRDGLQGYLMYNDQGHATVHLTTKDYQNTAMDIDNFNPEASINVLKHLANNYNYIAQYRIIESDNIIEHRRLSHSNPNQWNEVVQRKYEFSGDTLFLLPLEAKNKRLRVVWIKSKS